MTGALLAFDTSTEQLSIGVRRGAHTDVRTLAGGAQASATLIPTAMAMLAQAGLTLPQLDAVVFGRGPGAFTGLRTACAVAQGLAFGAGIPVLPVDTLLAVAEEARVQAGMGQAPLTVLAVLDARMAEVYSAVYDWHGTHWQARSDVQLGAPERVQRPEGARVLIAGNAFAAYDERLLHLLKDLDDRCTALPTASALLRLAPALLAAGQAVPAEQAMPLYIRDKVAQTTAEREAAKAESVVAPSEGPRP